MTSNTDLATLPMKDLQARFAATVGTPTTSRNRPWLIKRLQAAVAASTATAPTAVQLAAGVDDDQRPPTKSKRKVAAKGKTELTTKANPPRAAEPETPTPATSKPKGRAAPTAAMPKPGTVIRKTWRKRELVVTVQADGYLLDDTVYRSLSAAASALCGGNRNGLVFFGLKPHPRTEQRAS